ncbi:MAG: CDP-alcohol phosphatidyltransferase family protein [Pseudomonadota bacterium]|nr:CDP-alcohol phosphatidyltransferase family protein [Pseudomonadota bacterium]|tara:strand:+ start:384 stop:962 length:579 start_codon:yes stop_codon:yes gene_type:complete
MNLYRSLPNLLTGLRLFAVPIVVFLLLDDKLTAAFWVIVAAGLSDGLDGYLAKRMNAVTKLGTYLDPVADKILLIAVFVCLVALKLLPVWFVCLVIMRDILIIGGVIFSKLINFELIVEPMFISKLNTLLQILLGMWALGQAVLGFNIFFVTLGLIYLTAVTTLVSGTIYLSRWTVGFDGETARDRIEAIGK